MKVYLALIHHSKTTDVVGVFSTLDRAKDAADARAATPGAGRLFHPGPWQDGVDGTLWTKDLFAGQEDGDGLEVQEWTIDEQPSPLKPHDRPLDDAIDRAAARKSLKT